MSAPSSPPLSSSSLFFSPFAPGMVEAELTTEVWNWESAAVEAESVEAESTAETESAAAEAESVEAESAAAETESVEAESTAEAESATAEAESMNAESTAEAESAAAEVESPCLCSPQQAPLCRLRLAWEPRSPSPPASSASANGPSAATSASLSPFPASERCSPSSTAS
uniref:OSJNBb0052B05.15 protein n=1 Tax=Oryza sativa subsp. japonica TaxID=39947 RepID=Q7X7T0_ORYSJ|nr:OSJNBb0052B05.15 [Oryza sativa Japonica Group]